MSFQSKFTPLPLDGNLTLDRAYEWHRYHSTDVPAFTYQDEENKQQFVTWGKLGDAIDNAVEIIQSFIPETTTSNESVADPLTVGILSAADPLTYTTFLFGHLRLTHAGAGRPVLPFLISTRNSPVAVAHLMSVKKVKYLWVTDGQMKTLANEAINHLQQPEIPSILTFPTFSELYATRDVPLELHENSSIQDVMGHPTLILHSSGSTAFPKPLVLTHTTLMEWAQAGKYGGSSLLGDIMAVHNSPMFHAMGIFSTSWAAFMGYIRAVPCPNSKPPTDPERFLQAIQDSHANLVFSVPSFIEAWAADPSSVEALKKLKTIYWGGGPLSEKTGKFLKEKNVNIVIIYGATEFGAGAELAAKPYVEGYEWFRFPPNTRPALLPDPEDPDTFELVFKECETHHLLSINTRVDGAPAYATSDLVQRNKQDPALFRIKGRKDDQIMLSTGEKTNPGPMEHIITKSPYVNAAIMFGRGRVSNGVLIEPASYDEAEMLGLERFRTLIWPNIEEANDYAPAHSRIFKEMILVASRSRPFSFTAKNTPRRGLTIKEYSDDIDAIYKAVDESTQTDVPIPAKKTDNGGWSLEDSQDFVHKVVHSIMKDLGAMKDEDDIFSFGCDSLQATYIRNTILHALRQVVPASNVQKVPSNFVYQHPTVESLAKFVADTSQSCDDSAEVDLEEQRKRRLQELVHKYTQNWPVHKPSQRPTEEEGEVILLTGSTGGLGSQILAQLVTLPSVTRIYAFNRPSKKSSRQRHAEAFTDRGNDVSLLDSDKIVYVEGDTSVEGFAIDPSLFQQIQSSVTTVIHNAWRVDFNLSLTSFEPAVHGVRHMIDLALGSPHAEPPRVMFTSSIGNIRSWSNIPPVPEEPFTDLNLINMSGYSESKWVSERILEAAINNTALKPVIVRVGQLSGGVNGNWNAREWFPSLVRASQVVGGAPDNRGLVSFVPLHVAAAAIIDLRHSSTIFAHIVHPKPVTWRSVIETVAEILGVPVIPYDEWLSRLEAAPRTPEALHNNPALHLLDFYHVSAPPQDVVDQDRREAMGLAGYETTQTVANAPSLNPDTVLPQLGREEILRWIGYWKSKASLEG